MNKVSVTIKKIASAIIGYSGSSESPEKTSLRLMAIIMGILAKFTPTILFVMGHVSWLPEMVTPDDLMKAFTPLIQAGVYTTAVILYFSGLIRAVITALKTKNLGALYGGVK